MQLKYILKRVNSACDDDEQLQQVREAEKTAPRPGVDFAASPIEWRLFFVARPSHITMSLSSSKAERLAKRLADHGRHLFVYHQIWTNQVIYSLERSMNVRCQSLHIHTTRA